MAFNTVLADRIWQLIPRNSAVSERKMFGGLAFMLHGNMFCGVVKSDLMLRLGEAATALALKRPHTRPMDFTGKPSKTAIYVDATGIDSDESLRTWVEAAFRYAASLPPKK